MFVAFVPVTVLTGATTTTFLASAYATAAFRAGLGPGVVAVDTSTTVAPLSTAYRIPAATALLDVTGWFDSAWAASITSTGRMSARGATPTRPVPGVERAAIRPATNVPWPRQSLLPLLPLSTSRPVRTTPARPLAAALTPESTTAITWPAPMVRLQMRLGASWRCGQGMAWY